MRNWIKNLLLLLVIVVFVGYFARHFKVIQEGTDFPAFYAAARMVRDGQGARLYDPELQEQYQMRYAGRVGSYYIHPPFETLLYLPLAFVPLTRAYLLWCLVNAALLTGAVRLLAPFVLIRWDWRIFLLLCFTFVPILLTFLQGQDSILLLFLLVAGLSLLRGERPVAAGCVLAIGLFKFHLLLPVLAVVLLRRPARVAAGAAAMALALLLISVRISGWDFVPLYPQFLFHLSDLPMAGNHPEGMANLHGLLAVFVPWSATARIVALIGASLIVFVLAARGFRRAESTEASNLAFANCVIAATLVGYHLSPHDQTILLLPMGLISHYLFNANRILKWRRIALIATLAVLFLPPLHLLLLQRGLHVFAAVPVLVLFLLTHFEVRKLNFG